MAITGIKKIVNGRGIHLETLCDEECLWKPSSKGINVCKNGNAWQIDWTHSESYEIGPPNIAWLMWHITFWWSMVFDHSFGQATLKREDITWGGSIKIAKETILGLRTRWLEKLDVLTESEFISNEFSKWPFSEKPFYELATWLNLELMKNAAEIGYCRFLYATQRV